MNRLIYSNNRIISLADFLILDLAIRMPEIENEPREISRFRQDAKTAMQACTQVSGSIIDSTYYEYARRMGWLS